MGYGKTIILRGKAANQQLRVCVCVVCVGVSLFNFEQIGGILGVRLVVIISLQCTASSYESCVIIETLPVLALVVT